VLALGVQKGFQTLRHTSQAAITTIAKVLNLPIVVLMKEAQAVGPSLGSALLVVLLVEAPAVEALLADGSGLTC
jgi:hypothetical protein